MCVYIYIYMLSFDPCCFLWSCLLGAPVLRRAISTFSTMMLTRDAYQKYKKQQCPNIIICK